MFDKLKNKLLGDRNSQLNLIRRLLVENAIVQWQAYAFAAILMSAMAACMAIGAYLIGHAINEAYGSRDIIAVIAVCTGIIVVSTLRGFCFILASSSNGANKKSESLLLISVGSSKKYYVWGRRSSQTDTRPNFQRELCGVQIRLRILSMC